MVLGYIVSGSFPKSLPSINISIGTANDSPTVKETPVFKYESLNNCESFMFESSRTTLQTFIGILKKAIILLFSC